MWTILNALAGGAMPLILIIGGLIAGAATLFGIRRSGVKAGKAAAQAEGQAHVEKSVAQAQQIEQSTARMSDDAARAELLKSWSRPEPGSK